MAHTATEPAPDLRAALATAREAVIGCTACSARPEAWKPVPARGALRPRVLLVGRNPGRQEDDAGRPFIGPAGKKLDEWILAAELDLTEVTWTNMVKCYTSKNRPPTKPEISTCTSLHLVREIQLLDPQLVVGFGAQVRDALSPSLNGEWPTEVMHMPGRVAVFHTKHPSAILRSARFSNEWFEHASLVKRWLDAHPWR